MSGRTVVGGTRVVSGAEKKMHLIEAAPFGRLDPMLRTTGQKRNVIKKPFLEKALSRKAVNSTFLKWIEIESNTSSDEQGILWHDGNRLPKPLQTDGCNVNSIN